MSDIDGGRPTNPGGPLDPPPSVNLPIDANVPPSGGLPIVPVPITPPPPSFGAAPSLDGPSYVIDAPPTLDGPAYAAPAPPAARRGRRVATGVAVALALVAGGFGIMQRSRTPP